jgi:hypothetical protein
MAITTDQYKQIGAVVNTVVKPFNYQVAPLKPAGGSPRASGYAREYRLQLINTQNDTSDILIKNIVSVFKKLGGDIKDIKFNQLSPNSSKFPSLEFKTNGVKVDLVIARGANKGENFEKATVTNMARAFGRSGNKDPEMIKLIKQLNEANKDFAKVEIANVRQRTGSTKKEGVAIERLGEIIGDIVLTDRSNKQWFVSLKDINGYTFSSYSGAASLFNSAGDLQPESEGARFLEAFGADLNQVQVGFDTRNGIKAVRKQLPVKKADRTALASIFERAWGMNYFYVKKESSGWKVFWLDRKKLNTLTQNITVESVRYPNEKSKQISIECSAGVNKYLVEIRNSKAGEYPNDIKIKVRK